jgi:2-oxoisovalerate dehydrogenase E1 component alpha subunit
MQVLAPEPPPPVGATPSVGHDGSADPVHTAALSGELAVALYEQMVVARELDERLVSLQREGRVTVHATAVGEEAAIIGAAAAMLDSDWLFLGPREGGAALWRGVSLVAAAHHAFGSAHDSSKGRNPPATASSRSARIASTSPLSGTPISHAVGVAWAARIRGEDVASLVFFGEGATSSADFHTALNFAGVRAAPVIALCRNNGWATSLPAHRQTASAGFASKAVAYGLRGVRVDGADIVTVLRVVREARARAAQGQGGTLVEAVTAPMAEGEGAEAWSKRDPVARMRRYLESRGLWSEQTEQRLRSEVRADVDRALGEAERSRRPPPESIFDDVYSEMPWHLREQRASVARGGDP